MDTNSYVKFNSINTPNSVAISDDNQFKNNHFPGKVSHVSSSEERLTLIMPTAGDSDVTEEGAQYSILKRVIKYILGVSILAGGIYSMLKLAHPNNTINNRSLKRIDNSSINAFEAELFPSYGTAAITESIRKSRHIHPSKNQPYYYYVKQQIEKCNQESFLNKCKKEHVRAAGSGIYYRRLILNVGYFPCDCPPLDNNKVNLISPVLNYTYTDNQPFFCKSKKAIDDCQKEHLKLKKTNNEYVKILTFIMNDITCYCLPLKGLFVNFHPPEIRRIRIIQNVIPINHTSSLTMEKNTDIFEKKSIINNIKNDAISIKKMYDFSCVDDSENITFISALKIISRTLKNPVRELAAESTKVHYYNTLHLGCPSKETMERIDNIATIADTFLNLFIMLLPENTSLIVARSIVSPLLMAMSQDLDNEPIDIDLINEISSNILFIFQNHVRTISDADVKRMTSMTEESIKTNTIEGFNNQFIVNKNGLNIIYKNKVEKLNFDIQNRPYLQEGDRAIFVGYNDVNKQWSELSSDYMYFYSSENIGNADKYNINDLYQDAMYNIDNAKSSAEIQRFYEIHKFELKCVIIGEYIIPIYKIIFFSGEYTFITATIDLPRKVVVQTPYGFVFDKESTDISYILGCYIENNMGGEHVSEENVFSKINDNKISYDSEEDMYIKHRGMYYSVDLYNENDNIYSMISEITGDEIYIKIKGSEFDFHESTTFNVQDLFMKNPSFLSKIKDGYFDSVSNPHEIIPMRSENQHSGYIYFKTYAELLTNGDVLTNSKLLDTNAIDLQKLDSLIYWFQESSEYFLNVNDKFYIIEENTDAYEIISIKNKNKNKKNIKIYHHDDLLIQIKEDRIKEEYPLLASCKSKRDITDIACKPFYISRSLQAKLDNNIRAARYFSINDDNVKIFNSDLGLFKRKRKLYYYYRNRFFEVKLHSGSTSKNKFSGTVVDVYATSIFRRKRKITSFMFVNKGERIELKEPDVFLSEITGNEASDMGFLLENKKYYKIPNIFEINNSINEINRSKKITIVSPNTFPNIYISHDDIINVCRESFYNRKNDINFSILNMDDITPEDDFYIWAGKVKVATSLKYARKVVSKSIDLLKRPSRDVNEYLKSILNTDDEEITKQFSNNLRVALENTLEKLDDKLMYLVSAIKKPEDESLFFDITDNVRSAVHHEKVLDEINIRTGVFAFSTMEKNSRIYICTDRFYLIDPTHPDDTMHQPNEIDLAETLIHEATHAGHSTTDSYYMPYGSDGLLQPIIISKNKFINSISTLNEKSYSALARTVREYVERISLYDRWKTRLLTDRSALAFFVSKDTGIMANIYLNNADFLTKICKDIYHIDVVDKGALHYYPNFVNVVNMMALPIRKLLNIALDDNQMVSYLDSATDLDSFPTPVRKASLLDILNNEEKEPDNEEGIIHSDQDKHEENTDIHSIPNSFPVPVEKKPLLDTIEEEDEYQDEKIISISDPTKHEVSADIHPVPHSFLAPVAKKPLLDTIKEEYEYDDEKIISISDQTKHEEIADIHPVPHSFPASVAEKPLLDTIKEEEESNDEKIIRLLEQIDDKVMDDIHSVANVDPAPVVKKPLLND